MRSLVIVLDSVGVGGALDAAQYGDEGADTMGHICARVRPDLPVLCSLGLDRIMGETDAPAPRAGRSRA